MRIVVGITGATGSILGVRLLEELKALSVETHLVVSRWGRATLRLETGLSADDLGNLAARVHSPGDMAASVASGSFHTDGMVIVPCSMRSLAVIRSGIGDGLIARAADVTLKERRRLVLVARETPLSEIHLDNMMALTRMGAVILPPVPAFYNQPKTVDDIVTHIVARILDQFGLDLPQAQRWE